MSSKTGVTYYEDMIKHRCLWDPNYPECPERFSEVLKRCIELGLISRCQRIASREATTDDILTKHSPDMITLLEDSQDKSTEELEQISSRYDSIYICPETYKLSKIAVGSAIELVKQICDGQVQNGMAIIRPPGHHAMKSSYCGFCFYNNVALAADYALKHCNVSKILIVDWDVHHGQATQQMFYDDKRVLYFSIHRFEYGRFWPNLPESDFNHIGNGSGLGYNFNVPLNKTGFGNTEYSAILHDLLLPVALEYEPDFVIISSGYDAAIGCPEGEMKVEPAFYAHMINALRALAGGRIAVVLEGGYFLKSLAEGAALTLRALLADPTPNIDALRKPDEIIVRTIRDVIHTHRPYWKCFQIYDSFSPSKLPVPANSHNSVVRFEYNEEPLQVFPTRQCYPVVTQDMREYFTDWLDDLIESTILHVPKNKCSLIAHQKEAIILDHVIRDKKITPSEGCSSTESFFSKINSKNVDWELKEVPKLDEEVQKDNCFVTESLFKAIQLILTNITRSVVIEGIENDIRSEKSFSCSNLLRKYWKTPKSKIVIIDLHYSEDRSFESIDNILNFKISNNQEDVEQEKYNIKLNWHNMTVGNLEYLTLWFKTVLPICYQFAPELVVVFVDFDNMKKNQISAELPSYLIHWLTSLALGKMIVVSNKVQSEFAKLAFTYIGKTLVGEGLNRIDVNIINKEAVDVIKSLNARLEDQWSLNGFVQFPEWTNT